MIILLDEKEYAVGLSWFAISTTDEVEQFQRELDLQYGVLKMSKGAEQSTVALCAPEYNGQVSLAGMLSYAYQNLLYVTATDYKDDNGQPLFYLCAIKNHAVTVDGDVIGTREAIVALYSQNFSDLTADIDPSEVTVYGSGVNDELFPGVTLIESHQVLDQATRFASQATIKPLGKKEVSKLTMIAVLVIFSGICIGIYEHFFNQPPPPPPPPVVKVVVPVPVAPKRDPHQDFLQQFEPTLQNQPRAGVILSTVAALKAMPVTYSGWLVSGADFTEDDSKTFTITLTREPYGKVNDLMQINKAGNFSSLNVNFDGNSATATLPIDSANRTLIAMADINALPNQGSPQYFALLNNLQENPTIVFTALNEKNPYFAQTKLTFTGEGLWRMVSLFEVLSPFPTLGIKTISVKIANGTYNWIIEGVIYG